MCKRQLPNILIMNDFDLKKYLAEGRLLKEEFVKGTPQYYVKYTTQDGETAKSGLMSKREAIYKERDLVDSGVKKSSVHKIQKNMDLNGKEYEIEYELDKDIEYRTDEEGKPIMENIQDENKLLKEEEFVFPMEFQLKEDVNYESFGVHGGILYKGAYVKDRIESTYDEALYVNVEAEHEARLDKDDIRNLRRLGATLFYR